tara:strand:- start:72 stop:332 length:261 start_codon:yes stop_codon:yes gene_type:complete
MAYKNVTHKYRLLAMEDFATKNLKVGEVFELRDIVYHVNNYRNSSGKIHRFAQTNNGQMTSLLSTHDAFEKSGVKKWKFIGFGEEE